MMAIAVAAMSFTACSNDLTEDVTPSQEFTVQINAVENLSRTHFGDLNENKYPTLWDATDKIKVALNYATAKNSTNTEVSIDGTTAVFTADLSADTTAPYTVYAVSPAEVVNSQYINKNYNSWTLTIPANQTPEETSCDPAAQVLVGQSAASETRPTSVDIAFSHLTAYAKINFTNVNLGTATVNSVTITADQNIAGKFYYYVADNSNGDTAGSIAANVASKTIIVTTERLNSVWVALAPTTVSELTFTINTDQGPIIKEVTGLNKEFKSGVVATFNVDMIGKTIEKAATIDFSKAEQRTSYSTSEQVWSNAGITLTNTKGSSTSNVGDYKDPARFYKNSSITISAPSNITKLYFECDGADYATALKNSVGSAATASGTNVTVVLDGTSDTFTATLSEGKVFVNSLTVTYISTGQEIQTLSFDSTEKSANLGEDFTEPILSGAMTTVEYSSSDENVATVNPENGEVTLVGAGETTITATAEATEDYFSATASYTLTVIDPNAAVDYTTLNTSDETLLSTVGGTSASKAKVKVDGHEYDAIKLGATKTAGAWKVTVLAGTTKLHLHLAGWNGETVKVSVSGATVDNSSLSVTSDPGIANNSPFTLKKSSSTFYHELTLSNVTAATTLTFTATSGKRFVVWGVNAEIAE